MYNNIKTFDIVTITRAKQKKKSFCRKYSGRYLINFIFLYILNFLEYK